MHRSYYLTILLLPLLPLRLEAHCRPLNPGARPQGGALLGRGRHDGDRLGLPLGDGDLLLVLHVVLRVVLVVVHEVGVAAGVDEDGVELAGLRVGRRVVEGDATVLFSS